MKIYIVNGSGQLKGGAEKVALTTGAALAKRGHFVTILAAHGPVSPELSGISNLEVVTAHPGEPAPIENMGQRLGYLWPKKVGALLRESLRRDGNREAVIHFHSGYLEFGIPGFRELAETTLPLVYTHHDYAWACPLMGFYDYRRQASCPLEGGSLKCLTTDCVNSHIDKWIRFARHLGTHQTSGIGGKVAEHIFVSKTSMEKIAPYLPSSANRTVLPNPADFPRNSPVEIRETSVFTWVGRLTVEKDPVMLAEAARAAGIRCRFIGDGPLFEQVRSSNPDAEMSGWKSGDQVQALMSEARALVMTSRWLEAAPLVLAEAFCRGIPAIVPSETAAAEFVAHGVTGLIYESRNRRSLEEALHTLNDSSTAAAYGAEAYRRFWINPPNWDSHLSGLEQIYQRAIREARSPKSASAELVQQGS